jgi:hypothetical protein
MFRAGRTRRQEHTVDVIQNLRNRMVTCGKQGCLVPGGLGVLFLCMHSDPCVLSVCVAFFQCSIVDLSLLYIVLTCFALCVSVFSSLLHCHCYTV